MKWSTLKQARLSIFLLALMTLTVYCNWRDQQHAKHINRLVHELYEDRLMAESYIHQLAEYLHQFIAVTQQGSVSEPSVDSLYNALSLVMTRYESTNLTALESKTIDSFKSTLTTLETTYKNKQLESIAAQAYKGLELLQTLARIQLEEGLQMKRQATALLYAGHSNAQIELIIVLLTALLLQYLVLNSTVILKKVAQQKEGLN